jgi:hypothetical protein
MYSLDGFILAGENVYLFKLVVFRCINITVKESMETINGMIPNHDSSGTVGDGFVKSELAGIVD